ncbi:MAG: hypothetical protein IPN67_03730 [Bacteroidales bacterium]|nr:hypothetical protein [Bacteroidales bacterium]
MDLTRRIRDKMMKERLMFAYRGVVTNENSVPLLMLLEKEMESSEFGFAGRKRLFMFVLESLQNVSRHTSRDIYADMSLVVYSKTDSGYTVTTGNVIPAEGSKLLREKLEQINRLDAKEIREVYRQMLSASEFSNKGGAGLGLLEMAKKTGNKLDYDFVPLSDDYSYYILSKTVDEGGIGVHFRGPEKAFRGKAISQLERLMSDNNVNMIWCGHISSDVGKEVLTLTETKLSEDDIESAKRKRVFRILVELLDNVAKYSPGKEAESKFGMPVAMIKLTEKSYSLTTGNLILSSQVDHLKEKIDIINKYDKEGLKEFFIKSLSGQTINTDSTGNMGLIDMARKSGSRLKYQFEKVNDLYSYYIITVKVSET